MAAVEYKLKWDESGKKQYESGVSHGVLYRKVATAVSGQGTTSYEWRGYAWNGLTSVTESPEGADLNDLYADNIKYASLRAAETFGGTIEAYTYPPEFEACDGLATPEVTSNNTSTAVTGVTVGQQAREVFGLCYRTEIGNDETPEAGYKLHIVYNCTCSPSEKAYETINDSPDAITFSWEFKSTPVEVTGLKHTSVLVIDSTKVATPANLVALEKVLYGYSSTEAKLLMPDDVISYIATGAAAA